MNINTNRKVEVDYTISMTHEEVGLLLLELNAVEEEYQLPRRLEDFATELGERWHEQQKAGGMEGSYLANLEEGRRKQTAETPRLKDSW